MVTLDFGDDGMFGVYELGDAQQPPMVIADLDIEFRAGQTCLLALQPVVCLERRRAADTNERERGSKQVGTGAAAGVDGRLQLRHRCEREVGAESAQLVAGYSHDGIAEDDELPE